MVFLLVIFLKSSTVHQVLWVLSILSVSLIFVCHLVVLKLKDDMYKLHIFRNISWNGINLIIPSDLNRIIEKKIRFCPLRYEVFTAYECPVQSWRTWSKDDGLINYIRSGKLFQKLSRTEQRREGAVAYLVHNITAKQRLFFACT